MVAAASLSADREKIRKGGRYLIIDDIVTSGATVNAAVRNLYFCGADKVFAAAVARDMLDKMEENHDQ